MPRLHDYTTVALFLPQHEHARPQPGHPIGLACVSPRCKEHCYCIANGKQSSTIEDHCQLTQQTLHLELELLCGVKQQSNLLWTPAKSLAPRRLPITTSIPSVKLPAYHDGPFRTSSSASSPASYPHRPGRTWRQSYPPISEYRTRT
jgi:hypothetical protein